MVNAVVKRSDGSASVTVPVVSDSNGGLVVARDIGKPTLAEYNSGNEDPRVQDNLSALESWTMVGLLSGASAYADAKTLAEDIIKPRVASDNRLRLDLTQLPEVTQQYDVVADGQSACTLTYQPGRKNMVGVQLTLTRVSDVFGGTQTSQTHANPDSGTGIKIDRNGTSVTLDVDETVTRKVGRPGTNLTPKPATLPNAVDTTTPASDVFELSTRKVTDDDGTTLAVDILRDRLGTDTIDLHFLSDLYTLDAYTTVPTGSQAHRHTYEAGVTDYVNVPKIALMVVDQG